jgi:hypothetical protein
MTAAVRDGLGAGGLGFLVPGFAVNDAGDFVLGVLTHAFPDAHDVTAGGIDEATTFFFQFFAGRNFGAEGGDDDDIVFFEILDVGIFFFAGKELDAHGADLIVDLRVMNNLAENVDGLIGEDLASRISEVDGAFDAVAEAELLGELDGEIAG